MGTLKDETTRSQLEAIRKHLLSYGWIDKPQALEICGCERLGARIWDLRHDKDDPMEIETGWRIFRNRYGHSTRVAVYRLRK